MLALNACLCFLLLCAPLRISCHDYCRFANPGSHKLFCLGVYDRMLDFGPGYGCLFESSCDFVISARCLYPNSTWFMVYIPIAEETFRLDVWFMITVQKARIAKDSSVSKKLGIRETMIAKGELLSNGSLNVYSYRMQGNDKIRTSSSFFSFAPDRKSSRRRGTFGSKNFTIFSWRSSEYLTEGSNTFNYHQTPVRVTLRTVSRTLTEEKVTLIQSGKYMIFQEPAWQRPTGQISYSTRSRDEL